MTDKLKTIQDVNKELSDTFDDLHAGRITTEEVAIRVRKARAFRKELKKGLKQARRV